MFVIQYRPIRIWQSIIYRQSVFTCAFCTQTWRFFPLAVGFLSGLQVLKSMRFNTSSNLTLSDIALKPWKWDWKDTEALFFPQSCGFMSLRWGQLSFHWSVMPQREKTKLPLKVFHLCLFYDFERPDFNAHPILFSHLIVYNISSICPSALRPACWTYMAYLTILHNCKILSGKSVHPKDKWCKDLYKTSIINIIKSKCCF